MKLRTTKINKNGNKCWDWATGCGINGMIFQSHEWPHDRRCQRSQIEILWKWMKMEHASWQIFAHPGLLNSFFLHHMGLWINSSFNIDPHKMWLFDAQKHSLSWIYGFTTIWCQNVLVLSISTSYFDLNCRGFHRFWPPQSSMPRWSRV